MSYFTATDIIVMSHGAWILFLFTIAV